MRKDAPGDTRLLKKWQKGLWNLLFSKILLFLVLLLVQFLLLLAVLFRLTEFLPHAIGGQYLITFGMVLYLINSRLDPSAKLTWLVAIMISPVFGSLLYLVTVKDLGHRTMKKRLCAIANNTATALPQTAGLQCAPGPTALAHYVYHHGGYPIFQNTQVTYLPSGEEKLRRLLDELEHAKHFIFLEYFIIEEGVMWGQILDVLIRKAAQGVDVRVIYDGTCEFTLLPKQYPDMLKARNIQCKVFSPFIPFVSTHYNFRDHRKILVIDGNTAFNGGINLADEYIGVRQKFGHWKDAAVMLKGPAVKSFTKMFLDNWNLDEPKPDYTPLQVDAAPVCVPGFVMPYADQPLDGERVGENVYLDLINRANRFVYIMTPYLILDAELENALLYAAARGIRVKLILPGIPDKKLPYALAKTHYEALLQGGVEIYEYTPGFVHAKVFLCDGREAIVGTINLDYRSLYHHFECATYINGAPCLDDIHRDFEDTLQKCRRITPDTRQPLGLQLLGRLCKIFAPLM